MSLELGWTIEGGKELSRRLQGIGDGIKDWTPAFKETADELLKVFSNEVFDTQGRVVGEAWPPLKPKYLSQKVRAGYPADPLIRTGKMKGSFHSLFQADYAEVWNSAVYFKYHQSKEGRSKIPRRVMMKLGENQKQLIVKVFHTYWYMKVNKKI